jgi:hypothetical protein
MPSPPNPAPGRGAGIAEFWTPPPVPFLGSLDGPLRRVKLAGLMAGPDDGVLYWGTGAGDPAVNYPAEAVAQCYRHLFGCRYTYRVSGPEYARGTAHLPDHEAPHEYCTCGFYASARFRPHEAGAALWWQAEVDLYGDFIAQAYGWRFARQRVIAVRPPTTCRICLARHPAPDAAYLATVEDRQDATVAGTAGPPWRVYWALHSDCLAMRCASRRAMLLPPPAIVPFAELRARLAPVELDTAHMTPAAPGP